MTVHYLFLCDDFVTDRIAKTNVYLELQKICPFPAVLYDYTVGADIIRPAVMKKQTAYSG